MQLTRAAAYAVFATVHLAEHAEKAPIQGREIAEACHIPPSHLLKILQLLVHARILSSERGASGGFALNKPARDITLLEIVEAVDGPISGELSARDHIEGKTKAKEEVEKACHGVASFARLLLKKTTVEQLVG